MQDFRAEVLRLPQPSERKAFKQTGRAPAAPSKAFHVVQSVSGFEARVALHSCVRTSRAHRAIAICHFASAVLLLTKAKLGQKLSFAMDGVLLFLEPNNATVCKSSELHRRRRDMHVATSWRGLHGLAHLPSAEPAPAASYQGPRRSTIFHAARKLAAAEWCRRVVAT